MKHSKIKSLAARTVAACILAAGICLAASVPTEWTVRIGPRSAEYQAERRHGDALDLRASLVYNGQPLPYSGQARLYAQTNGMGSIWWDLAPVSVESNVLHAVWLPSFDTGADVVDLLMGGPSNYQAAARIRFLPSPGSVPNALPLPVQVLDFSTVIITNSPFVSFQDLADATNDLLQAAISAAAPGNYETVSNRAMSAIQEHQSLWPAVAASTNYTDAALGAFASTGAVARAIVYGTATRWTDATGCVWEVGEELGGWTRTQGPSDVSVQWHDGDDEPPYTTDGAGWYFQGEYQWPQFVSSDETATTLTAELQNTSHYGGGVVSSFAREMTNETNLVGRVALTNDLPNMSGYATQLQATNAAIAVAASKQDALPYPTNAIPYAAITGSPTPPSVFYDAAGGAATVSGATLTYQAASNSVGSVALLAGTNVLHITAPAAITGRVRDFGLTVTTEDSATITLDQSVSWRFDAASTNLAAGSWNRVYCTESPSGVFSLQLWTPESAQEATP